MFGLGETSSPDTPPVKTYRCVACSSTFLGLASLLVHQASHAGEFSSPKPPPQPSCSSCGTLFFTRDLLKQHVCAAASPPTDPEFYICDCGKDCKDFNEFLEHKKSHHGESYQMKMIPGVNPEGLNKEYSGKAANSHSVPTHSSSADVSLPSSSVDIPPDCSDSYVSGINVNEKIATQKTIPPQNSNLSEELDPALDPAKLDLPLNIIEMQNNSLEALDPPALDPAKLDLPLNIIEMQNNSLPDTDTDESLQVSNNSATYSDNAEVQQNQNQDVKPDRNKVVMKILAKAYMNVKQPPELEPSANNLVGSSGDVRTPGGSDAVTSSIRQLRPSVRRPFNTRSPTGSLGYGNNPSKKPLVISVARRYCPVVLLETRQKFVGRNDEGNYQCGQCRRRFSNIDELALHHALHRKEKMKRCRRCTQFIISTSGPDNHICSRAPTAADQDLLRKEKEFTSSPKKSLKAVKTTQGSNRFHCPLCNHSYSRLYSLKMHNCEWISSLRNSAQEAVVNDCPEVEVNGGEVNSFEYVSVGVGTVAQHQVKKEMFNESVEEAKRQTEPNSENPFEVSNEPNSVLRDGLVPNVQAGTIEHVGSEEAGDEDTVQIFIGEQGEEEELTSSAEEAEIDVLIEEDEDDLDHNDELHQSMVEGSAVLKSENEEIPVAVYDEYGKRFTCGRCHKSFTRNYGLKKHQKICARGRIGQPHIGASVARKILASKKVFDCVQCGKIFSHMDSLAIHKRSCHTEMTRLNELPEPFNTASQESVFVLPPQSETPSNRPASTAESKDTNWGIMSLPSVLPRRVTCECGSSFTCPRRLFEHLQMHAQESYICPHCGESLQSWMKYEVHLRSHLQFPPQPPPAEQSQQYYVQRPQQPATAQLSSRQPSSHVATQASTNCPKCFQTFKNRRCLLRHMRLRCHGEAASAPKKYSCSRCGMSFLSTYTLDLHRQSNTCTPSVKTMRCPVCVRWFRTVEGLKRHLIVHSQQKAQFSCGLCPQSFSSPEDLEGHKKSVHDDVSEEQEKHQFKFFRCNTCPRVYHSMKSLKEHRRKVHSLIGGIHVSKTTETLGVVQNSQMSFFRCQLCQRSYHSQQALKNHRRRVHRILEGGNGPRILAGGNGQRILAGGNGKQRADSLGAGKQRADALGAVQNHPSNIFRCQICQRVYPTLKAWRNHRRRVHRILGGGSEMQLAESLRVMHNVANTFACQICHKTYLTLQSLKDHRRKVHHIPGGRIEPQRGNATASQPFLLPCQICHRSYGSLQSLKDHRRKVHHIPGGRLDV